MLRTVGGIVAGTIVAFLVIWLIETAGHLLFPLPEDLDLRDPEAVAGALPSIPLAAKFIVVLAWFAGALAGGCVAKRIGRRWWSPWLIAAIVAFSGIVVIMMIPHPVWMQISAVAAPLLGGLAASHLVNGRRESIDADL
jgi:hypothetical protein